MSAVTGLMDPLSGPEAGLPAASGPDGDGSTGGSFRHGRVVGLAVHQVFPQSSDLALKRVDAPARTRVVHGRR